MKTFNNSGMLNEQAAQSYSKNQGKAFFSFIAMSLCTFLLLTLTASLQRVTGFFITALFMVFVFAAVFLFQYGFAVIITRLYTGQRTVIGHLFNGFRDIRRGLAVGSFIAAVYVICSLAVVFIAMPLLMPIVEQNIIAADQANITAAPAQLSTDPGLLSADPGLLSADPGLLSADPAGIADALLSDTRFPSLMWLMMIVYMALCILILFRYIFVWYILASDETIRPYQALRKSRLLMKGNWIKTALFCAKRGGKPLIAAAAAFAVSFADLYVNVPSVLAALSGLVYTAAYAVAFVRMSFALAAVFYSLLPENQQTAIGQDNLFLPEQI